MGDKCPFRHVPVSSTSHALVSCMVTYAASFHSDVTSYIVDRMLLLNIAMLLLAVTLLAVAG